MRLFIGSFLDKDIIEKIPIENIQKLFEGNLKNIKKENIHMTWVFLGNVGEVCKPHLREIIDKHINIFKGLIFKSEDLCFWPPTKLPRLIVIKGNLNKEINLSSLVIDLKQITSTDTKKDFLPHITVCRFKKDKTINKKIELPKMEDFTWHIKEVSLIQSTLLSEGPRYEKLKQWVL